MDSLNVLVWNDGWVEWKPIQVKSIILLTQCIRITFILSVKCVITKVVLKFVQANLYFHQLFKYKVSFY